MYGHLWTIGAHLRDRVLVPPAPPSLPWRAVTEDPHIGRVVLSGQLCRVAGARSLVIIIHGLGGSADSGYCRRAASACVALGASALRINLRGADLSGEDIYHAGLTDDIQAALASPLAASVDRVLVLGFSLGGHIALSLAIEASRSAMLASRLTAVAAVCSPLDLQRSCAHIDAPGATIYRAHLLRGLRAMYAAFSHRRDQPAEILARSRSVRTMREWDELITAPRHGFANAEDYYRKASAGSHLGEITIPTLYVAAAADPMVARKDIAPALVAASPTFEARVVDTGGHVAFPRGFEAQVIRWLLRSAE